MNTIYLTIDDAPSADFGRKREFLRMHDIPAIWFCRGDLMEDRFDEMVAAVEDGCWIANHSFSHPHFSRISLRAAKQEILDCEEVIERVYREAGVDRPMKLFRFPYGDKGGNNRQDLQHFLTRQGFEQPRFPGVSYDWFEKHRDDRDVFWTFDCEEWRLKGVYDGRFTEPEDVFDKLEQEENIRGGVLVDGSSADIVLLHDHVETTRVFLDVVEHFIAAGAAFRLPER